MKKRVWSEEEISLIKKMYLDEGMSIVKIAKHFTTRTSNISNILKDNNVRLGYRKNRNFKHDFFNKIDTEEKAYLLGLMIADGSVTHDPNESTTNRSPMIRLEMVDKDIVERISKETQTDAKIKKINREGKSTTYLWAVRSREMADDLRKYGVIQGKTISTNMVYNNIPKSLLRHYVRGLIDGDGSLYIDSLCHVSFTGYSESFVNSVQLLCQELINKDNLMKITNYDNIFKFTYNGKYAKELCRVIYKDCNISINRKQQIANKMIVDDIV